MEQVALGSKVARLGINRVNVAVGSKCRVVLLDPNPCMKHVAFDEEIRRSVEVDQDMCLKFGLRPSPTFYYLVAKLNTDLEGRVIGDKFTVEYLQLSETQNNELADSIQEQGVPKSLVLTKLKKTNEQGKDMSVTKVTLSVNDPLEEDKNLAAKINAVRANADLIASSWKLIDASTTIPKATYFKLKGNEEEAKRYALADKESHKALESAPHVAAPAAPEANDFAESNEFEAPEDFKEGFDK